MKQLTEEKISEFVNRIMLNEYNNSLNFSGGWDRKDILESWQKVMEFTTREIFEILENDLFKGFCKLYDEEFSVSGMISKTDWELTKSKIMNEIR